MLKFECRIVDHDPDDGWSQPWMAANARAAAEGFAEHRCNCWVAWPNDLVVAVREAGSDGSGEEYEITIESCPVFSAKKRRQSR